MCWLACVLACVCVGSCVLACVGKGKRRGRCGGLRGCDNVENVRLLVRAHTPMEKMASVTDETRSLKGNVVFHPKFSTFHDVPVFFRSASLRVVSGSMLLSGIVTTLACITTDEDYKVRFGCALSTAISIVAFYHYSKLVSIRDQSGSRVKLATPGDRAPMGSDDDTIEMLKIGWQEMAADAVRYSDWTITLPVLVLELHLLIDGAVATMWFSIPWATTLTVAMLSLGAYTRFGTDELVPVRPDQKKSMLDTFARVSGLVAFALACVCLFFVLYNLLGNVTTANDPTNGWVFAFSLPWIGYGLVAAASMAVRQFYPSGYPEALSVSKDLAYGALDVWSKAVFGLWVAARALGVDELVFSF